MIEAVFIFLLLLVLAWAANQFVPHPIGLVIAVVLALLALYVIVDALVDEDVNVEAVAPLWLLARRR